MEGGGIRGVEWMSTPLIVAVDFVELVGLRPGIHTSILLDNNKYLQVRTVLVDPPNYFEES